MTVFVFPGQGSQFVGMSKDFYDNFKVAKDTFQLVEDVTKINIKKIIFENENNLLNITQYTQLAIFCSSISIFNVLKKEIDLKSLNINAMLGHSLGEYTALTAADYLSITDCSILLKIRGELMQNAYETNMSGMAAIIGMNCEKVENLIKINKLNLEIANDNSPMQIVISGGKSDLLLAENIFKINGAKKYVLLNVSAAFHSKYMLKAQNEMNKYIDKCSFKNSSISIVSNYNGEITNNKDLLAFNLSKQMSSRVRWVQSINSLSKVDVNRIIEIGPGKVLSGLIKRINDKYEIVNIDIISDISKINNEH